MRPITLFLALVAALVAAPPAAGSPGWLWPVHGRVITPYRNGADPYAGGQHRGIDVAAPVGTPVVAATGGTVTFAGPLGAAGIVVGVRTGDDRFDTSYLHLSAIRVRLGERVAAGDELGAVGTTGRRSAVEPHLHFGVRESGSRFAYRDPLDFLPPPAAAPEPAPRAVPVPISAPIVARSAPVPGLPATLSAPLARLAGPVAAATLEAHLGAAAGPAHAAARAALAGGSPAGASPATGAARRFAAAGRPSRRGAAPARRGAHAGDPRRQGANRGTPAPRPAAGPGPHPVAPGRSAVAAPEPRRAAHGSSPDGGGIDLGWLAACAAMVAAAALLGRPAGSPRSLRRAFGLPPVTRPSADPERP